MLEKLSAPLHLQQFLNINKLPMLRLLTHHPLLPIVRGVTNVVVAFHNALTFVVHGLITRIQALARFCFVLTTARWASIRKYVIVPGARAARDFCNDFEVSSAGNIEKVRILRRHERRPWAMGIFLAPLEPNSCPYS